MIRNFRFLSLLVLLVFASGIYAVPPPRGIDPLEAKRKARIEQRRAKRASNTSKESEEKLMHDIDKPITLEDLTNPDKN